MYVVCVIVLIVSIILAWVFHANHHVFLGLIVAIIAGVVTFIALVLAKKAIESQILMKMNEEYATEDMKKSVRVLFELKKKYRGALRGRNVEYNPRGPISQNSFVGAKGEVDWTEIDEARRKVKFYFINLLDMLAGRFISKAVFLQAVNKSGITILFDVVEHLEQALNADYEWEKFHKIFIHTENVWEKYNKNADMQANNNEEIVARYRDYFEG